MHDYTTVSRRDEAREDDIRDRADKHMAEMRDCIEKLQACFTAAKLYAATLAGTDHAPTPEGHDWLGILETIQDVQAGPYDFEAARTAFEEEQWGVV